ncbi:MAG: hypothetical protein WAW80_03065 [Candidatus Saccharimonadales bacterium]
MKYTESVPNNPLEGAFMRYVSETYETNGKDFSAPEIKITGDVWKAFDNPKKAMPIIVTRMFIDAAVKEMLLVDNGATELDDGEAELSETTFNGYPTRTYMWYDGFDNYTIEYDLDGRLMPGSDSRMPWQAEEKIAIQKVEDTIRGTSEEQG